MIRSYLSDRADGCPEWLSRLIPDRVWRWVFEVSELDALTQRAAIELMVNPTIATYGSVACCDRGCGGRVRGFRRGDHSRDAAGVSVNRAMRRAGRRGKGPLAGLVCVHGNVMKTDGKGTPMCPHGCGFEDRTRPEAEEAADV